MPLFVYRSRKTEALVAALERQLERGFAEDRAAGRADPFAAVEIVVGSRGMERWLRHELARGRGRIAAQLAFPFPRAALNAAAARVLGSPAAAAATAFDPTAFVPALIALLRAHAEDTDFAAASRYVADGDQRWWQGDRPVSARELLFAHEVSAVLDRLLHDRPEDALQWIEDSAAAPAEHRWLARLLAHWEATQPPGSSPAERHRDLLLRSRGAAANPSDGATTHATLGTLHLFGLSTLGQAEVQRIDAIARHFDVHFYVLTPSSAWWAHIRTPSEQRRALRQSTSATVVDELAAQNPLLASLGRPSRDLQSWLEHTSYLDGEVPEAERSGTPRGPGGVGEDAEASTLATIGAWLDAAGDRDELGPLRADTSLELHAAFGAVRQVEALRDRLLALLDADPSLTPRDILVMTPDIETFAPLCGAILARRGQGVDGAGIPALRSQSSDLGVGATNGLAALLLALLAALDERVTAATVCALAALEPVRLRLGIEPAELAELERLAQQSGMRWGFDNADRAAEDQPETALHTLRFGLERLALGALWSDDDGPLDVVGLAPEPASSGALGVGAGDDDLRRPLPLLGATARRAAALLTELVLQLQAQRRALAAPRPIAAWREALVAAVDALGDAPERASWQRAELIETLEAQLPGDEAEPALTRRAIARLLQGAFAQSARGDRPITGAVTVCALEPMRSVPYRVIALLGMDDGAFPRASQTPTWSPFSEAWAGERDRREVDRHLLLEALLSARDHLLIFWSGRDLKTGDALPAAVPIEELVDLLIDRGDAGHRHRDAWVHAWPMQPWSPARYAPTMPPSFDADHAAAAAMLARRRRDGDDSAPLGFAARGGGAAALTAPPAVAEGVDVRGLARALAEPAKTLLYTRLHAASAEEHVGVDEREPFELDGLQRWSLKDRAFAALLAGAGAGAAADGADADGVDLDVDVDEDALAAALLRVLRGEGALPHGVEGERLVQAAVVDALVVHARLPATLRTPTAATPTTLMAEVGGLTLRAKPPLRVAAALGWPSVSGAFKSKGLLEACYGTLVARLALGDDADVVATCVNAARKESDAILCWRPPPSARARAWLSDAVALWLQAQQRALPLFAETSYAIASVLAEAMRAEGAVHLSAEVVRGARPALRRTIDTCYVSGSYGGGEPEGRRAANALLWQGWSPLDALDGSGARSDSAAGNAHAPSPPDDPFALALRLWTPVLVMSGALPASPADGDER